MGGVQLDPLVSANDTSRPLASRLLAVPELRTRYLGYVRDLAENWLDWEKLGPLALRYQRLIEADVTTDPRKLDSTEAFFAGIAGGETDGNAAGGREGSSLKGFAEQRRAYLLQIDAVKSAPLPERGR